MYEDLFFCSFVNPNESKVLAMNKLILLFFIASFIFNSSNAQSQEEIKPAKINILVFSKTNGFRHNSIPAGIKMISELGQNENWIVTCTENANIFTSEFMNQIDVAVFLNPTKDVLDDKQQKAFEKFIKLGKGFVGIHAATDCEYDWPWYGGLSGAYFSTHPPAQEGTVIIEDTNHPAMKPFEGMSKYITFDEWYSFTENPRGKVHVLASLDESSIKKEKNSDWRMGDHPVIWYQEYDGARSFYTVFGHTSEAFEDENVQKHIAAAINWAAKRID